MIEDDFNDVSAMIESYDREMGEEPVFDIDLEEESELCFDHD